jgi:hypothetical protein
MDRSYCQSYQREIIMRELSLNEVESVSGGLSDGQAAVLTGLAMLLAPTSIPVVLIGTTALHYYAMPKGC